MSFVKDIIGGITGSTAADASIEAAGVSADAQSEALDYLKQVNAVPQQYKEQALGQLGDFFLDGNQQQFVDQSMANPFYQSMIGQGEEALLRNQAVTGGLRSGGTQQALAQNSQNVLQNLVGQQLGGISGLAGLGTNENAIAQQMGNIGMTQAQGITGAAQAGQQGIGNIINLGATAATAFSDERLKDNVVEIGEVNGQPWHAWTWNDKAEELGLSGDSEGIVIQKLDEEYHELIGSKNGYLTFDYGSFLNG